MSTVVTIDLTYMKPPMTDQSLFQQIPSSCGDHYAKCDRAIEPFEIVPPNQARDPSKGRRNPSRELVEQPNRLVCFQLAHIWIQGQSTHPAHNGIHSKATEAAPGVPRSVVGLADYCFVGIDYVPEVLCFRCGRWL